MVWHFTAASAWWPFRVLFYICFGAHLFIISFASTSSSASSSACASMKLLAKDDDVVQWTFLVIFRRFQWNSPRALLFRRKCCQRKMASSLDPGFSALYIFCSSDFARLYIYLWILDASSDWPCVYYILFYWAGGCCCVHRATAQHSSSRPGGI
jgi:hypothetical protein